MYINEEWGYCFAYPGEYPIDQSQAPEGIVRLNGPALDENLDPIHVSLEVTPRLVPDDSALAPMVDAYLSSFKNVTMPVPTSREPWMLGNERAEKLEPIPGLLSSRVILALHRNVLYQLRFHPSDIDYAKQSLDDLTQTVIGSFAFLNGTDLPAPHKQNISWTEFGRNISLTYDSALAPWVEAGWGDRILGIDEVMDPGEVRLRAMVAASPGREIALHVDREGERLVIALVPRDESGVGRIGVVFRTHGPVRQMGLGETFVESLRFNGETARALFLALRSIGSRLFRGEIGAVRAFSGPIEIAEMSRRSLEDMQGFLQFLAILSLNLGIFNLLPIPVLDGGHILLLTVEGILRKDLSLRIKERGLQVGFVFLILLFGAVRFFDVVKRWFPS